MMAVTAGNVRKLLNISINVGDHQCFGTLTSNGTLTRIGSINQTMTITLDEMRKTFKSEDQYCPSETFQICEIDISGNCNVIFTQTNPDGSLSLAFD